MAANAHTTPIKLALHHLGRTCSVFQEKDSGFAPTPGQFTVAQQVAHVAQTIDWFVEGAFGADGFDMDFAVHQAKVRDVHSLQAAMAWLARAVDDAAAAIETRTPQELAAPIAAGPVMGGQPRSAVAAAIAEHTAHHRGSLAVYARLCGYAPPMPYAD